jgi:deoxyxylulose-5-phosphate synthase
LFNTKLFDNLLAKGKPIFIYEEVVTTGSLGERLCTYARNNGYDAKIYTFSINDEFINYSKRDIIIKELNLDIESVVERIRKILGG